MLVAWQLALPLPAPWGQQCKRKYIDEVNQGMIMDGDDGVFSASAAMTSPWGQFFPIITT